MVGESRGSCTEDGFIFEPLCGILNGFERCFMIFETYNSAIE